MRRGLLLLLVTSLFLPGFPVHPAAAAPPDFVELARDLKPYVVNINTTKTVSPRRPMMPGPQSPHRDFFDEFFDRFFQGPQGAPRKERSLGSGFIITEDGYILTNDHVVSGADEIRVRLADGRSFLAEVKGLDPKLDIALLKIEAKGLPVAALGDSTRLQVGEWVMAIGNPFGLEQTITVGIVSAKGRVIGAGPYDDFIQTDASINPGNSGGPLFNMKGEVVGINTAIIAGGQGIGFATPIDAAKNILPQLKEFGRVTRGWLGVSVQEVSDSLAESFGLKEARGALISEVIKGSPAEKAGLRRGDIILSYNGQEIRNVTDLPRLTAATPVDQTVKIGIFRDGKTRDVQVKVGRLEDTPQQVKEPQPTAVLGLSVTDVTPEAATYYGLVGDRGALVTAIDPAGLGAEANLMPGDLILELNGREIADAAAFRNAAAGVKKGQVLRLLVQRGENLFYTTITAR